MSTVTVPADHMLLQDKGIILEANRNFFHPIGFDVNVDGSGHLSIRQITGDAQATYDQPKPEDTERIKKAMVEFQALQQQKHSVRQQQLGYVVQPPITSELSEDVPKPTTP